jgi:hypothetical protein
MHIPFTLTSAQARFLSGLFTNLAAGWFGITLKAWLLTFNIFLGIVCSVIAIKLEELLELEL